MASKKKVVAQAKPEKPAFSAEELDGIRKAYNDRRSSIQLFTEFFLKDDPGSNFTVPTRSHRIVDDVPAFQSEIFKKLDGIKTSKRFILVSPRGFMKSTTCSVELPIWATLFKHFKEILIVSNSEALAINFLRSIKVNLESNERIVNYFSSHVSDKWTESHLITKDVGGLGSVSIRACGWGAQIRGFRPDLIIMDDIESDETVLSEEIRKKMKEWILKAALNSLTIDGCVVWVGTLINRVSVLYDWAHNPPEGWSVVINRAYKDGIQEAGHELWPSVWTHERLQLKKKEIGTSAFSSEFMNEPIPSEGNAFNPSTFRYFEDAAISGKDVGMYIAVDPAFSEGPDADFGVIMCCLHDSSDNIYVHSYYRQRTNSRKLIDELKRIYRYHRDIIRAIGIEEVGPQKSFYQQVVSELNQDGLYPPFKKLTGMVNTTSGVKRKKEQRIIYSLQPRFEASKIFLRRDQHELIDELTMFSESGNRHDDMCDALSYVTHLVEQFQSYDTKYEFDDLTPDAVINNGITGYGEDYGEKAEDAIYFG